MIVQQIYEVLKKKDDWAITIWDVSGNVSLGCCNSSNAYSWDKVPEAVKYMTVEEIWPCSSSLYVKVTFESEAAYASEERCKMDGYEFLYHDPQRGPVYAKETWMPNCYEGGAEFIGYTFSTIEGWC